MSPNSSCQIRKRRPLRSSCATRQTGTGRSPVRAMLPEISPGSYLASQVRYGIDFEGIDDGRMLRQLRIALTLNINLPHNLVGWKPTPSIP